VAVAIAEEQPLTVLVATTVNTPDPLAIGLEMLVLFKLPVAGGVQV
jgi:hypothetical protein